MRKPDRKKSPNRLLIWLTGVSLGVHVLFFIYAADVYRAESLTYIDLSVRDLSEPAVRSIPRPRLRVKPPEIQDAKVISVKEQRVPQIKIDPVETRPERVSVESVSVPRLPDMAGVSGVKIGAWTPPAAPVAEFMTRQDYMNMVRLKIESRKKYPEAARAGRREGKVRVRFTVTPDGLVTGAQVVKGSGHEQLDQAALSTVTGASPLPRVPATLFKGAFQMEIVLAFELM